MNTGNYFWRRRRDLNPRYPFGVYTISNRARSASYATSPCRYNQLAYNTAFGEICQELIFIFSGFFRGKEKAVDKEGIYSYNV